MTISTLLFVSITAYVIASILIMLTISSNSDSNTNPIQLKVAYWVAVVAALAHIFLAYQNSNANGLLDISLSSMLTLVSAIVACLFLFGSLVMRIQRLGVLLYPIIILSLLLAFVWQSKESTVLVQPLLGTHIVISLMAYAVLSIATIQSLLAVYQERQVKRRVKPTMLLALPPLQTMETLLFRLLVVGFILLTLTLLSGAIFSEAIFGYPVRFEHHHVLAIMGWSVYAITLYKRSVEGLRGSAAMIWITVGFTLILLGYFGTKAISESLT